MHKAQVQVQKFCRDVSHAPTSPDRPQFRDAELRARLIAEEASETVYALVGRDEAFKILQEFAFPYPHHRGVIYPDLAEVIDGICDIIYVAYGTAEAIGVDLEPFFDEVHESNMAKAGAGRDEGGKIVKPPGWVKPRIAEMLARYQQSDARVK